MEIGITGASGFVGTNLCTYLNEAGFAIKQISRKQFNNLDEIMWSNLHAIIHLAGKAHDLRKTLNADEYYEVNCELTKKLYDAFLKSDIEKFIFISSVKAVADSFDGVLTEQMLPNPKTDYGKSKLMAEQYIQAQPLPEGKSYYILRPCMIHGPGNKGNLNLLFRFVQKRIPYPLAAFKNKRSFLSVENLCFVIKELTERSIPSGVYQVADNDALSTNEVVSILAKSVHRKPQLWAVSPYFIKFLSKIGNYLRLPLNSERLNKLTENYIVSNEKIKMAIEKDLPVQTIDGIYRTAKSFTS